MAADASGGSQHDDHQFRAWAVWGLAAFGFSFAFFTRVSPSVMGEELMREFAVGAAVLGNLSAIYFYIYACSQIPIGILMDRWGPRSMITVSLLIAAAGSAVFSFSYDLTFAYLGRFLIGAGSACAFVGALILAGRWFAPKRFALMSGLTMLAGMAGGLVGQAPLALLVDAFGWRHSMLVGAGFAFVLALAVWLVVRDHPPQSAMRKQHAPSTWQGGLSTLASFRLWGVLAVGASFSGPMLAFGALWGVPYMTVKFGLDRPDAALYVSFNLLGWAVGAPLSGWLSDHFGRRKLPLLMAGLLNVSCMSALFYLPGISLQVSGILIFAVGALSATMVLTYALAREITRPSSHGAVTGFINMGNVGAGAILQPIVGIVLDAQWDGSVINGVRHYTFDAYNTAFLWLIGPALAGLVFILLLPETHCRQQVE